MSHVPCPMSQESRPCLGIILSQFPRYDEAFILRDLVELDKAPWELCIFSLKPCRDRIMHDQAKRLVLRTIYCRFFWSWAVWRSQLYFLRRNPGSYWRSLTWVFSRHYRHPIILAKVLVMFPKTVHFARLAKKQGVSLLHAGWATYPATAAVIMSQLTGIPYSLSTHAHDIYTTNPALVEKMQGAEFVLTCTEENRRYLERISVNASTRERVNALTHSVNALARERVDALTSHVNGLARERVSALKDERAHAHTRTRANVVAVYHGVDLARFAPAAKSNGATCRILSVGSLLPSKGFETLIEACAVLKDRGIEFQCTIAGGGPLERSLKRLIARRQLAKQVELTGFVSQEEVRRLYQQAHLFVLPLVSRIHWGIPNVLIEALATKTPVVCCDLPSMRELVVHGTSGWVIPEQNPQALSEAIGHLWKDATLRERLAEVGYQRVAESFSLERTGQRLRQLFARCAR